MAKSDRIVTRLESEMRAKLHAKASAIGLDDAAYVRMLIYRDLNEIPLSPARQRPERKMVSEANWPKIGTSAPIEEETEPLLVEEMDIPADADGGDPGALDELLGQSPSILDEMMALSVPNPAAHGAPARSSQSQTVTTRGYRAPLSRRSGVQPVYGPGSKTRAIGVNDQAIGANDFGDGRGNVLRENMRHFGIVGTRSR